MFLISCTQKKELPKVYPKIEINHAVEDAKPATPPGDDSPKTEDLNYQKK